MQVMDRITVFLYKTGSEGRWTFRQQAIAVHISIYRKQLHLLSDFIGDVTMKQSYLGPSPRTPQRIEAQMSSSYQPEEQAFCERLRNNASDSEGPLV